MTAWRPLPIPASTARYHASHGLDQWLGDSVYAVRDCRRARPVGKRFIDLNLQDTLDGVVCLHSRTARENGYRFIQVRPGKRRPMTNAELDRPLQQWKTADVRRWRRTAKAGKSRESRVGPRTAGQQMRACKRNRVIPCFEIKSFALARFAKQLVAYAESIKWTAYWMTLAFQTTKRIERGSEMVTAGEKLRAFHEAGGQTALLAHDAPQPADLAKWEPVIDRIWGKWA